jgi:transcriptional regulator with XRE-family HTH domain
VDALSNLRQNLKLLRKAQNLTQEQVAERAGLDYRHYQRIERGKWPGLQLHTIESLAKVFGVKAWDILSPPK